MVILFSTGLLDLTLTCPHCIRCYGTWIYHLSRIKCLMELEHMGRNHNHTSFSFTFLWSSQADGFWTKSILVSVRCARVWHIIWIDLLFCTLFQSKGWAYCRKTFALHMKCWHPTASRVNQKEFCGSEAPMQIRDWQGVQKSDIFNATIVNLMKCQISFSYLLMEETPWNTFNLCGLSPKPEKANVLIWCSVLIHVYHMAWFFLSVSHTT